MINYEVNLEIEPAIYENFLAWLGEHIREILNFAGFMNAYILQENVSEADGWNKITVRYELDTLENLQSYFDNHATAMRKKTEEMFGNKIKASRKILKLTQKF